MFHHNNDLLSTIKIAQSADSLLREAAKEATDPENQTASVNASTTESGLESKTYLYFGRQESD
jgi:hypothetical protein